MLLQAHLLCSPNCIGCWRAFQNFDVLLRHAQACMSFDLQIPCCWDNPPASSLQGLLELNSCVSGKGRLTTCFESLWQ